MIRERKQPRSEVDLDVARACSARLDVGHGEVGEVVSTMSIFQEALCQDPGGVLAALAGAPSVVSGDPIRACPGRRPDLLDLLAGRASWSAAVASLTALRRPQYLDHRGRQDWRRVRPRRRRWRSGSVRVAKLPGREDRLVLGVAVVVVRDQGAGVPLEQAEQVQGAVPRVCRRRPPGEASAG